MDTIEKCIQKEQDESLQALFDHNDGKVRHGSVRQTRMSPNASSMSTELETHLLTFEKLGSGHGIGCRR